MPQPPLDPTADSPPPASPPPAPRLPPALLGAIAAVAIAAATVLVVALSSGDPAPGAQRMPPPQKVFQNRLIRGVIDHDPALGRGPPLPDGSTKVDGQ